jgi:toxin HigB-1
VNRSALERKAHGVICGLFAFLVFCACCATRYNQVMIVSFKHKGLRMLFETGSAADVQAAHARRLTMQLAALHTAQTIDDMDIHSFRLHALKGTSAKRWSIWVNGNWRVTFEFKDGNVYVIDYEDYH